MSLLLGVGGVVFAAAVPRWVLLAASLTGALSTDVVESGPFTSLEQPMLAVGLAGGRPVAGFGLYNAVATAAGSLGALAAGLPGLLRARWARSLPRPASPSRWACRSCSPGSSRPATTSPCGRGSAPCRCPAPAAPVLPGRRRAAVPPGKQAAATLRLAWRTPRPAPDLRRRSDHETGQQARAPGGRDDRLRGPAGGHGPPGSPADGRCGDHRPQIPRAAVPCREAELPGDPHRRRRPHPPRAGRLDAGPPEGTPRADLVPRRRRRRGGRPDLVLRAAPA